jgi:hypothetical protein
MKFKATFALLAVSFVMFASDGIVRFASHRFAGVAWAQDATDADQADDVSSGPDVAPPDLQGTWTGPIVDESSGTHTLTLDIFQNHSKLKGTWSVPGGSGKFKGKINSAATAARFTFKGNHKCVVNAPGELVSATEIQGTYTSKHCSNVTSGSFDLTLQP